MKQRINKQNELALDIHSPFRSWEIFHIHCYPDPLSRILLKQNFLHKSPRGLTCDLDPAIRSRMIKLIVMH